MNLENANGFDIPQGPDITTSSIGSVAWPPTSEGQSFERYKGFCGNVIENSEDLETALSAVLACDLTGDATRVSTRIVLSRELINDLRRYENIVETLIPLDHAGEEALSDCILAYIGRNSAHRPSRGVDTMLARVESIFEAPRHHPTARIADGYTVRALSSSERDDQKVQQDYIALYSLFGWTPDEVITLLGAQANTLIAAFDRNGSVVASGVAEVGDIPLTRNEITISLRLAEITEAATLVGHRGLGLYTAISGGLLRHLANQPNVPHVVYGEMNSRSNAVLKTAAGQGRLVGLHTAHDLGFPRATHLPQHVTIHSGTDEHVDTRYNDLVVGWLLGGPLKQKYGR